MNGMDGLTAVSLRGSMTKDTARCMGHRKFADQCAKCGRLPRVPEEENGSKWIESQPRLKSCGKAVAK